ncbi:MAG: hypothetical protein BGO49_11520 [Planctomycetales bacterium 71-10]|nr:MAG: hypothetical protein BGO49_11520 [Planctomycetales bacterium 71-10]
MTPADFEGLADALRAFIAGELGLELSEDAGGDGPHPRRTFAVGRKWFITVVGDIGVARVLTAEESSALDAARGTGLEGRGLIERLRTPPTAEAAARAVFTLLEDHWAIDGGWRLSEFGGRTTISIPGAGGFDVLVSACDRSDDKSIVELDEAERRHLAGWNAAGRPAANPCGPGDYRGLAGRILGFLALDLGLHPDFIRDGREEEGGPDGCVKFAFDDLGCVLVAGACEAMGLTGGERELIEEARKLGVPSRDLLADLRARRGKGA